MAGGWALELYIKYLCLVERNSDWQTFIQFTIPWGAWKLEARPWWTQASDSAHNQHDTTNHTVIQSINKSMRTLVKNSNYQSCAGWIHLWWNRYSDAKYCKYLYRNIYYHLTKNNFFTCLIRSWGGGRSNDLSS